MTPNEFQPSDSGGYHDGTLVPSDPPPRDRRDRAGVAIWPARLAAARLHPGCFFRVAAPMKLSTAKQIASDLRSTHRRELKTIRVTGVVEGERWNASWGQLAEDPDPDRYYVWICWLGES